MLPLFDRVAAAQRPFAAWSSLGSRPRSDRTSPCRPAMDASGRRSTASNARSRHDSPRGCTKDKTHSVSGSLAKSYPGQTRSGAEGEEMSAPEFMWTPEKDGLLRSMGAAGESTAAIATLLKRTPDAVRQRARLLKIKLARSPPGLKAKGK